MKIGFYPRLAWIGITKNRKLYLPYILTCAGMVMMFYIISFLSYSETVSGIRGGETIQAMLSMGIWVIGIFSLIFLFYTNSFLIRRRKREFGLYNILGMGKWNLARILTWESIIIAAFSFGFGLIVGILFSKAAELCMINILSGDVDFSFSVSVSSISQTVSLFAVIFFLILLNGMRRIHVSNPVELLHSERTGEKPPKANWLLALLGTLILGAAYYIAVSIEEPVAAMMWFFVAVAMVIVATYILFVAGSVVMCRLLQKKKNYYYKTKHFVSVSSMVYRMKRNGAGLASICILATMVLVMLSSTTCLYIGAEDSMRSRYPRNIVLVTESSKEASAQKTQDIVRQVLADNAVMPENILSYSMVEMAAYIDGNQVCLDDSALYAFQVSAYTNIYQLFFVPLEDYNRLMGKQETLAPDEVLAYVTKSDLDLDTLSIDGYGTLKVKKYVPEFVDNGVDAMQVVPSVFIFVPDFTQIVEAFGQLADVKGDKLAGDYAYYGFDLDCGDEMQIRIADEISEAIRTRQIAEADFPNVTCEGVAKERAGFYGLYGGLFFLGVLLSIVFLAATVLIMYYKQISEGFEDQSRFEIMQKVGMTKKEIRKSINSQVLIVFFLPLLAAGVHLAFAFPIVSRLMVLFGLTNEKLLISVTAVSYLIFGLFYIIVYRITSGAYYNIVSSRDAR